MSWTRKEIFKYALVTIFLTAFAILFLPFFSEILLAAVVALAMEPFLGRWLQPRHFRWRISVLLILVAMFHLISLPVGFVGYRTYGYLLQISKNGVQNSDIFQKLTHIKGVIIQRVDQLTANWGLEAQFNLAGSIEEWLGKGIELFVNASTQVATQLPSFLISIFVFCAALYYFLAEARTIKSAFMKQRLLTPTEANRLIKVLQNSCFGTVVTSLGIALMQATIVSIGAAILGVGDWAVIWAVTFFLSFIPVVGAAPVALALGLYVLIMGEVGSAIGFLIVAVVAGTADNIVRPFLISSNEQDLNPVVSLLAIIGAILVMGMPGLFLGPVIALVAVKIIPTLFGHEPIEDATRPSKKAT
jgi:predicted PurR-regulated permease PerM